MRIFVTGATGVLGRPVVQLLVRAGHDVYGLARSAQNDALLRDFGALPISGSLFDSSAMGRAVSGMDAILHLATRIPSRRESTKPGAWAENDRIRNEATAILIDAALAGGVQTFIYPSVSFVYPDRGSSWIEESEPIDPVRGLRSTLESEAQVARFTNAGRRGIVLRMGSFYSPEAKSTREVIELAKHGYSIIVGSRNAYISLIWVDDAAEAVVAALMQAPAALYNVVDDAPLTRGEIIKLIAASAHRRILLRPPQFLVRLLAGNEALFLARSQRVSNRKFKHASGWVPAMHSAREGWPFAAMQIAMKLDGQSV